MFPYHIYAVHLPYNILAVLVTFDEKLPEILLKKFTMSVKGTVKRIDEQSIVIDFENVEGRLMEERVLNHAIT